MSRGQAIAIAILGLVAGIVWAVTLAAWPAGAEGARAEPPEPVRYCATSPGEFLPCRMVWIEMEA